ncbi:MFS transporter [Shewanella fodinae]|uniref:Putative MFS family arabinose efflux permease n=1 Tax=Shewanella fodinae TaxID=552357 RepID=A0A4R2F2G0_9GAMM|nr:MFS transporter [Shewanella fodinae]TCN78481.1 putative MFS family arabinose efflux permease [Shewanella fodinae]
MAQTQARMLSPLLILLMAVATGVAVANNYYVQPLLDTIANYFKVSHTAAGMLVTTAQLFYGAGLLLLVPLADMFERRRLIVVMMLLATLGLLISALATNLYWLLLGTAVAGACSVVAQVLVPLAATLADPSQRGRVVGTVMGGLLLGILLARVVAGVISTWISWQAVYWLAAGTMLLITLLLARALPVYQSETTIRYGELMRSLFGLFRTEPKLRSRSFLGGLSFAMFTMFWTPLAFLLANPPYEYSDATIGLFGLAGVAGVAAARWAGKLADSGKGNTGTWVGLGSALISWLLLFFAADSLALLLVGVVLLDLAVQLTHVSNQNVIYALQQQLRNRLNAGYMTCYFVGGALGSWVSVNLYQFGGWHAVCYGGAALAIIGLLYTGLKGRIANAL